MQLPKELTTVTKVSKAVALVMFITPPFIGFFMGRNYQATIDMENLPPSISIKTIPTKTPESTSINNWKTYVYNDKKYNFEFKYSPRWKLVVRQGSETNVSIGPQDEILLNIDDTHQIRFTTKLKVTDNRNNLLEEAQFRGLRQLKEGEKMQQSDIQQHATQYLQNYYLIVPPANGGGVVLIPSPNDPKEFIYMDSSFNQSEQDYNALFDKVLSSFRFLN